ARAARVRPQLVAVEVDREPELEQFDVARARGPARADDAPEPATVEPVNSAGAALDSDRHQAAIRFPVARVDARDPANRTVAPTCAGPLGDDLAHGVGDGVEEAFPDVAGAHRAGSRAVGIQHRPGWAEIELERAVETLVD